MKILKKILIIAAILILIDFGFELITTSPADLIMDIGSLFDSMSAEELAEDMNSRLASFEVELQYRRVDTKTVTTAFNTLTAEHPEYFWLDGSYSFTFRRGLFGIGCVTLTPGFVFDADSVPELNAEFTLRADGVIAEAETLDSDYDRALFIPDYLAENCSYDFELLELIVSKSEDFDRSGTTAYGCLIDGSAVCSGYSAAYQVLLNRLGIVCGRLDGESFGSGETVAHEWNYICLDGEYYYVDLTWDDLQTSTSAGEFSEHVTHSYFCISEEELLRGRTINEDAEPPVCVSDKYNYHRYEGYYLESYSLSEFSRLISIQLRNPVMEVKLGSEAEYEKACAELFGNGGIANVPALRYSGHRSVWHVTSDDSYVITLWF